MSDGGRRGGRDGLESAFPHRAVHEREDADDEDDPEDRERGSEERRRRAGQFLARLEERLQALVSPRVVDLHVVLQPVHAVSEGVEVLAVAHYLPSSSASKFIFAFSKNYVTLGQSQVVLR